MATRILVGVDAPILRVGLEHTLGTATAVSVVGWAGHPLELVEQVTPRRPDVVVCWFDALQDATEVSKAVSSLPTLAVADIRHEEDLLDALRGGLRGLLPRTCSTTQLVETVELLARGQLVYPSGWEHVLVDRLERMQSWGPRSSEEALTLTPRETDVLSLLLEGYSVKQVAARLGIAQQTTKNHIHHVMVKTGSSSRVDLVAWATKQGFRPSSLAAIRRAEPESPDANGRLGRALLQRLEDRPRSG